jgi:hypothetical protein
MPRLSRFGTTLAAYFMGFLSFTTFPDKHIDWVKFNRHNIDITVDGNIMA